MTAKMPQAKGIYSVIMELTSGVFKKIHKADVLFTLENF